MDWLGVGWWDLPGPSRFIEKTVGLMTTAAGGVTGLLLPSPRPEGIMEVLRDRTVARSGIRVLYLDASSGLRGRSPSSVLAATAGVRASSIPSIASFLDEPEFSATLFLVEGISGADWRAWSLFLNLFQSEHKRRQRAIAPSIALTIPTDIPNDAWMNSVQTRVKWVGQVSRLDTQLYIERLMGWPDDSLLERTAISVATEMSGSSPALARFMAGLSTEELVDPRETLRSQIQPLPDDVRPCWANGLVDHWDGDVWINTSALSASDFPDPLRYRVWRGQIRTIFPFIDKVLTAFVGRYESLLRAVLPIEKQFNSRVMVYDDPWTLEVYDIWSILKDNIDQKENDLLHFCLKLRRSMAHREPVRSHLVGWASETWEQMADRFPTACRGWDWTRAGQKLVLTVGPSGGGKTTWAQQNCGVDEIVSSDAIRKQLFGSLTMSGDQEPVFLRVRSEAISRLSSGLSVVIDATNIKKEDRLANVHIAPSDIPVEYVIIDRPMDEKQEAAGWRAERPHLLEHHARQFEESLPGILDGDSLNNVHVLDTRAS